MIMAKQFFIIVDGPMGSGKTTAATLLLGKLKRTAHFSLDKIKWAISDFKRSKRDNAIAARVEEVMADEYLKNGINVLIDQNFVDGKYIEPFKKIAKKHRAQIFLYQLEASRVVLLERLAKRPRSVLARKPMPKSRTLMNLRKHAKNKYAGSDIKIIDSHSQSPEKIAEQIIGDLKIAGFRKYIIQRK